MISWESLVKVNQYGTRQLFRRPVYEYRQSDSLKEDFFNITLTIWRKNK